jgi:hypothetical protein
MERNVSKLPASVAADEVVPDALPPELPETPSIAIMFS